MGRSRSTATTSLESSSADASGRKRAGSVSSRSRNSPSAVILARAWRSAEQLTAIPTGLEAPWRGRRTTRTSWQKYLPPNWAPIPKARVSSRMRCSHSRSRNPWPVAASPEVGRESRYLAEASLATLRLYSADVPPTTSARW